MNAKISLDKLYDDVEEASSARLRLATDKSTKTKKATAHDIQAVAESIASSTRLLLEGKLFPESFVPNGARMRRFDLAGVPSIEIAFEAMLSEGLLIIKDGASEAILLDDAFALPVAEAIVIALLIGRRHFDAPVDPLPAETALQEFRTWFPNIIQRLEESCRTTAFGTKFEDRLKVATLQLLGISPDLKMVELSGSYTLGGSSG